MENQRLESGTERAPWKTARRVRYRRRRSLALAFSLGFHVLIASLQLGDLGLGLPGLAVTWTERRLSAPELAARLVDATPPPASALPKPSEALRRDSTFEGVAPPLPRAERPKKPLARPLREGSTAAPAAETPARKPSIKPTPSPEVLALDESRPEPLSVPPSAPPEPEPPRAPEVSARTPSEEPTDAQLAELATRRAAEQELKQQEEVRQQAETSVRERAEEDARQRAGLLQKQLEAKKQEEVQRLAAEAEALRRAEEAARQQAARQQALEAQRLAQETEARQKAEVERRKEQEAQRMAQEAAERKRAEAQAAAERERLAAEQARAVTPGAGPASPAPALSGQELAAKVLGQLRAPAAVPLDPPPAPPPPRTREGERRFPALGAERDVVLRLYIESWRTKIERNGPLNFRVAAGMRAPEYPVVTVAIRSDGSVEYVHVHRTSGLREIDGAVRRIVDFYAPYSRFPSALAAQYDVIEIRRVWQFDGPLKIVEEMR